MQAHPIAEWLAARLVPWEHYVPVREDLDDLAERAAWLADHDDEARAIAAAALRLGERIARRARPSPAEMGRPRWPGRRDGV